MSSVNLAMDPLMQLPSPWGALQHLSQCDERDGEAVSQIAGLTNRILEQPRNPDEYSGPIGLDSADHECKQSVWTHLLSVRGSFGKKEM